MTEVSPRFAMPFLQAGQAQKELYHNEALALLDLALHPVAQAASVNAPPGSPTAGQCWIVGPAPTGAWVGHAGALAGWTGGGWRFISPAEGMLVWVIADGVWARRTATGWASGELAADSLKVGGQQVVGGRQGAIATPAGGGTIDTEARTAVAGILAALRAHGLIAT